MHYFFLRHPRVGNEPVLFYRDDRLTAEDAANIISEMDGKLNGVEAITSAVGDDLTPADRLRLEHRWQMRHDEWLPRANIATHHRDSRPNPRLLERAMQMAEGIADILAAARRAASADESTETEVPGARFCHAIADRLEHIRDLWRDGDKLDVAWHSKGWPVNGEHFRHKKRGSRDDVSKTLHDIEADWLRAVKGGISEESRRLVAQVMARLDPDREFANGEQRWEKSWRELRIDDDLDAICKHLRAEADLIQQRHHQRAPQPDGAASQAIVGGTAPTINPSILKNLEAASVIPAMLEVQRAEFERVAGMIESLRPRNDNEAAAAKLPELRTHDRQAWQLATLHAMTQAKVAAALNKEHGTTYTQGQVSRMIKRAKAHADASGLTENIPGPIDRPRTVDPRRLELGARVDKRKPRPSDLARGNGDDE